MKNAFKWEGVMPFPLKFSSVDSCDLKSRSIKFGNAIFYIFEMPRSSFLMSVGKMNISLLFRPSASEVLEVLVSEDHLWCLALLAFKDCLRAQLV